MVYLLIVASMLYMDAACFFKEKDKRGSVLWIWSYPTVTTQQRELLSHACCLKADDDSEQTRIIEFVYSQFHSLWYYIYTTNTEDSCLKAVS